MLHAALDLALCNPLNLRGGVPVSIWLGQGLNNDYPTAIAAATTLTFAAAAG